HNLDVIKTSDWLIDLGPEAGDMGGNIVIEGTPEDVARHKRSYTGAALKPVLSAGPSQPRQGVGTKDSQADLHATAALPDLGDDVKMPWERDGRAWHTVDHRDRSGDPAEWDPRILTWLVDTMVALGPFAAPDWNHRTRIEITAKASTPWFCHILTGGKDLLEVAIRVPESTFTSTGLHSKLRIKTLDERKDLPIYGQWDRIRHRALTGGWEEWRLHLRDAKDVSKAAFRAFLRSAVATYFKQLEAAECDPESAQPWKTDGEAWHLSQKSISKRHTIRWTPSVLVALIGRFKSMQPDLRVDWAGKSSIQLFVPGRASPVGRITTSMPRALRVELRVPLGGATPTQVDRLGDEVEIKSNASDARVRFLVRSLSQNDAKQLRALWHKCVTSGAKQELVAV
ncbi:MAG: hypothetical protein PVI86_20120, partial [Phycisphaerae bacterium]